MKRLLFLLLLLPFTLAAQQQASLSNPLGGDINAASTNCSVVLSCVWQKLSSTATTTTITISGTFVATLLVETSADGVTFTTSSTQSAATVVTLTTTSLTDVRVRASAYTSGRASVNIQTAGNQLNVTVNQGGGITPNTPVPAAQAQGPTYNIVNYGAKGDAQHIIDGVTAGGATKTVTSATANFQASDVGKFIACVYSSGAQAVTVGTTITARNSATSVSISANDNGAGNTEKCVWYTQNDGPAIRAAILAATPASASSKDPNGGPTLGNSGTAYCPAGGYAVTVNAVVGALLTFAGSGASIGPNFIGEGKTKCIIYPLADSTDPGGATIINLFNSSHSIIGGFTIDGNGFSFPFTHPIVAFTSVQHSRIYDVSITNISANMGNLGTLDFTNSSDIMGENIFVQGASTGKNDFACGFGGTSSSHFKNLICSNHNQTAVFTSGGGVLRGVAGDNGVIIENGTFDECGSATLDCTVFIAGYANFIGGWIGVGNTGRNAMNVDGTSRVWLSNVNCGQFGSTNVVTNCMTIASGGEVSASMSDIRGNGSGANGVVVTGPAGAKFNDIGGNRFRNCVSAVCTDITAATYATQGFTGGIVPKATVTHTPNTVVAVQGNLLATAQNLATSLNDQNYQILNITAQSGGTTPAASACATPPVITFSDGTRTATMTMTTAKTQWRSDVDSSTGIGAVFATGTLLTISIGANTCATPPANVSVSYILQSVLNP